MTVILCVGEYLEPREQGITAELVAMQTKIALGGVSKEELSRVSSLTSRYGPSAPARPLPPSRRTKCVLKSC